MRFTLLLAVLSAPLCLSKPTRPRATSYAGYLISTFSDANPQVQWHLSNGNVPSSFRFLNNGSSVLASTVGTGGVRDIFLATNSKRSEFYLLATGMCGLIEGEVVVLRGGG